MQVNTLLDGINIFQATVGLSVTNSRVISSIRCPHCRKVGTFNAATQHSVSFQKLNAAGTGIAAHLTAQMAICPDRECSGIVFVISDNSTNKILFTSPPELIDFESSNLPENILRSLKEAISCHSAGAYRASAMMIRRLLEEVCEVSGSTGANLHQKLVGLKDKISLPTELFDAMFELKALGNDAAHIEAKDYDNIGRDEAEDGIVLAKEILKSLYQLKSLVDRLRARKM